MFHPKVLVCSCSECEMEVLEMQRWVAVQAQEAACESGVNPKVLVVTVSPWRRVTVTSIRTSIDVSDVDSARRLRDDVISARQCCSIHRV